MSIRTVLIDDNNDDLNYLIAELKDISYITIVGSFANPIDAIEFISQNTVELVISDIEMPGINGINAIKLLSNPPLVIFVSSYPQYALESFDVSPLHYLVKPFSKESLLKATYRALETIISKSPMLDNFIFVYTNKNYEKINYSDILYIKAEQNYVKVFTKEKTSLVLANISQFLKQLPESQFMRIHKSYAVNTENITSYNHNEVQIFDNIVPISEAYRENTLNFLTKLTISRAK